MKKLVALIVAGAAVVLAVAAFAGAAPRANPIMAATKLTAAEEIPAQVVKNTKASGSFTLDITGTKGAFVLKFSGLTGPATAAHIHLGGMGKAGPVVIPLCGPCKSPVKGNVKFTAALLKDLKTHKLYVNVHTAKNPNGEIRGQLSEG
ncbi:MAG TPA: CHRD domain-containing protein [Gaiellaceae bacterium]|nr:CHRD domain-containing protein [Gaiellaceae bacterium]